MRSANPTSQSIRGSHNAARPEGAPGHRAPGHRPPGTAPVKGPTSPGPIKVWLMAARLPTLPAAVVPVLVGSATAVAVHQQFHGGAFVAALLASLLIQIGTNFANDLFDFKRGADTAERTGPVRVTNAGLLTPEQVARGTVVVFGLAFLIGLYLVSLGGWPILVIGVASIACGVLYTAGPWPLAYHGLGDVFTFVFFGVVAVVGTHYVHTGAVDALALLASIPVGLLVTAILVVNNLRDIPTDRAAGKRTLAVRLGDSGTRIQYLLFVVGAYAVPLVLWFSGRAGVAVWLPWASVVVAFPLVKSVVLGTRGPALNPVLAGTGRLHLVYGLLWAVGLLWG